jgi:hypothetical protein
LEKLLRALIIASKLNELRLKHSLFSPIAPNSSLEIASCRPQSSSVVAIKMPNPIRDLQTVDETSYPYIFGQNATVQIKSGGGLVRCNVYRPKTSEKEKVPVLVTYGPHGKDLHYKE